VPPVIVSQGIAQF